MNFFRSDKEFRQSLVNSVPAIDPILKVLLQEEGNALSEATKSINNATQKVVNVKDSMVGYFDNDKSTSKSTTTTPAKSKISLKFVSKYVQFN